MYKRHKYRLIRGHFHIGLVIIPRPPYMGRGMITSPIWKCPCIKLFIPTSRKETPILA